MQRSCLPSNHLCAGRFRIRHLLVAHSQSLFCPRRPRFDVDVHDGQTADRRSSYVSMAGGLLRVAPADVSCFLQSSLMNAELRNMRLKPWKPSHSPCSRPNRRRCGRTPTWSNIFPIHALPRELRSEVELAGFFRRALRLRPAAATAMSWNRDCSALWGPRGPARNPRRRTRPSGATTSRWARCASRHPSGCWKHYYLSASLHVPHAAVRAPARRCASSADFLREDCAPPSPPPFPSSFRLSAAHRAAAAAAAAAADRRGRRRLPFPMSRRRRRPCPWSRRRRRRRRRPPRPRRSRRPGAPPAAP